MTRSVLAVAVFVAALAVVGSALVGASVMYFPLSSVNLDHGQQLFEKRCASCHSVESQGVSPYGPNLRRIGATAAERVPNMSAEDFLLESIVKPNAYRRKGEDRTMPADISSGLDCDDVLSLVGYLMTRGSSPNYKRLLSLVGAVATLESRGPAEIDFAAVEAGKKLYAGKGKCIDCHPLRKHPGFDLRAPSLLTAGRHDAAYLRESIVKPSKKIAAGYQIWTALLSTGTMTAGRLVRRGTDSIELLTTTSESLRLVTIGLDEIELDDDDNPMLIAQTSSAMPDGYREMLTTSEIASIVTFLKSIH